VSLSDLRRVKRAAARVERAQRDLRAAILEARQSGETLRDIAEWAGLSHQRVHQIVAAAADDPERK
jgi:DNA-directed RNA polymerase sigma subunit (sigma70/sigma32)